MAQTFKTAISIVSGAASSQAVAARVDGDSQNRINIDAGGKITWGSGSAAGDTTLYRSASDVLKTDDAFEAASLSTAGNITVGGTVDGRDVASDGSTLDSHVANDDIHVVAGSIDGQVPTWDNTSGSWVAQTPSSGVTDHGLLSGLGDDDHTQYPKLTNSDTAPSGPRVNDMWYDTTNGRTYVYYDSFWVEMGSGSGEILLDNISDVNAGSPSSGEVLTYNGTEWTNANVLPLDVPTSGRYQDIYGSWGYIVKAMGSNVPNANVTCFYPHLIPSSRTFDAVSFAVSTPAESGSGSGARLAIYNSDPTTGLPSSLIIDAGFVSTETSGIKDATFSPITLPPGMYYTMFSYYSVGAVNATFHAPTSSFQIGSSHLTSNQTHFMTHVFTSNVLGVNPLDPAQDPAPSVSIGALNSSSAGMIHVSLRYV